MTKRSTLGGGALLALALLFIGLTILFGQPAARLAARPHAERALHHRARHGEHPQGAQGALNLYFFYSEKAATRAFPELKTYGTRVRELLEELAARSNGKLRLSIIDPQPFSEDEDRATELGVRGAPAGADGQNVYFGLAGTNSTDGKQAIEFFDPRKEEFLEYDVAKLDLPALEPEEAGRRLAVEPADGRPTRSTRRSGQPREPPVVYTQAEQLFTVKPVAPTATSHRCRTSTCSSSCIRRTCRRPRSSPSTSSRCAAATSSLFVDPIAEADQAGADPQNPMAAMTANKSSDPGRCSSAWGVDFNPREVVGDLEHALQVGMRQGERRCGTSASSASTSRASIRRTWSTAGLSTHERRDRRAREGRARARRRSSSR